MTDSLLHRALKMKTDVDWPHQIYGGIFKPDHKSEGGASGQFHDRKLRGFPQEEGSCFFSSKRMFISNQKKLLDLYKLQYVQKSECGSERYVVSVTKGSLPGKISKVGVNAQNLFHVLCSCFNYVMVEIYDSGMECTNKHALCTMKGDIIQRVSERQM